VRKGCVFYTGWTILDSRVTVNLHGLCVRLAVCLRERQEETSGSLATYGLLLLTVKYLEKKILRTSAGMLRRL
jgi:hypothetical protein